MAKTRKVKSHDSASKLALFRLFDQGKTPFDPEVKALGYKGTTVYTLQNEWKKSKDKVKLETVLPGGETIGDIDETKGKSGKTEAEPGESEAGLKGETPVIPTLVKGGGVPIRAEVSIGTLAYWEIAKTAAGNTLPLGDFLDICVRDFFEGRGQSLGLVKLNPGEKRR